MSSKNYKIIHQKIPNTTRYREDPLPINNKYAVFMIQDSNRVFDLIDKDRRLPHISMIDRFWGHKTQRASQVVEEKPLQSPQQPPVVVVPEQHVEFKTEEEEPPHQPLTKTLSLRKFKESLVFDERTNSLPKSTKQNPIIDGIIRDGDLFLKKPELVEQVQNLKRLQVLKQYEPHHEFLPGVGKLPYIINDYHSKSTNPGYSRNNKGNFFTR